MKWKIDKEEFKLQWLAALLSGDFKQTKAYLRLSEDRAKYFNRKPGHCCLGVQCELYQALTGEGEWVESGSTFKIGEYWSDAVPPLKVLRAFGMDKKDAGKYASMNDDGVTFKEIAREIDEDI